MPEPNAKRIKSYDGIMMVEGQSAELVVREFLEWQAQTTGFTVQDVRNDPKFQKLEVDYRLELHNGKPMLIEVKSDRHIGKTHNVLFELCRIHHTADNSHCAYLGWSVFTQSDRVFIWCPPTQELYIVHAANLRMAMQSYTHQVRRNTRLEVVATDNMRTTINILIPLDYVTHHVYQRTRQVWAEVKKVTARTGIHAKKQKAS